LRQIASKNNKKHFPLFRYQHKDSGDVCDTVQLPEKISPDYTGQQRICPMERMSVSGVFLEAEFK
jgi:hypothetical protein